MDWGRGGVQSQLKKNSEVTNTGYAVQFRKQPLGSVSGLNVSAFTFSPRFPQTAVRRDPPEPQSQSQLGTPLAPGLRSNS